MRKAMICVSVMLALLQFWPMVFGQHGEAGATASAAHAEMPRPIPAVAMAKVIPIPAKVSTPGAVAPKSCYKQYQAAFAACSRDDQACHIKTADQWDLCEATGFWPN
ncbi:MAG: hypothetical protein JWN66_3728 [Sphingomonas bacterium]|jgi:hypothetical protein|uniref:hypothetical protein n=1 Tax=Sphingomonas bacterium TaxID=1895847 RepID=UPI002617CCFB|nr:hypothetical protein [Sphingomonas bacterium]MDB5706612.1 hypothetical protein [Sphingomonas bacterium]